MSTTSIETGAVTSQVEQRSAEIKTELQSLCQQARDLTNAYERSKQLCGMDASGTPRLEGASLSEVVNSSTLKFNLPSRAQATVTCEYRGDINIELRIPMEHGELKEYTFRMKNCEEGRSSSFADTKIKFGRDFDLQLAERGFAFRGAPTDPQMAAFTTAVSEVKAALAEGIKLAAGHKFSDIALGTEGWESAVVYRIAESIIPLGDLHQTSIRTSEKKPFKDVFAEDKECGYSATMLVSKSEVSLFNGEPFGWVEFITQDVDSRDPKSILAIVKDGKVSIIKGAVPNSAGQFGVDKGAIAYSYDIGRGIERRIISADGSASEFTDWENVFRTKGITCGVAETKDGLKFVSGSTIHETLAGESYGLPQAYFVSGRADANPIDVALLSALRGEGLDRVPFIFGKWVDSLSAKVGDTDKNFSIVDTLKLQVGGKAGTWSGVVTLVEQATGGNPITVPVLNGAPLLKYKGLDVVGVTSPEKFSYDQGKLTAELIVYNTTLKTYESVTLTKGEEKARNNYQPGGMPKEVQAKLTDLETQLRKMTDDFERIAGTKAEGTAKSGAKSSFPADSFFNR